MENNVYQRLYYYAFNRLTDLDREIKQIQQDLEEMYLENPPSSEPDK